jgi:hypothetical protein
MALLVCERCMVVERRSNFKTLVNEDEETNFDTRNVSTLLRTDEAAFAGEANSLE